MENRKIIAYILVFALVFRAFACEHFDEENEDKNRGRKCDVAKVYMDDILPGTANSGRVRGVVYFEGFDFEKYRTQSRWT